MKKMLLLFLLLFVPMVYGLEWGIEIIPSDCSFDVQAICDSLNASSDFNLSSCDALFNLSNCSVGFVSVFVGNESFSSNFSSFVSENHTLNIDCVSSADFDVCLDRIRSLEGVISSNCSFDYSLFNDSIPSPLLDDGWVSAVSGNVSCIKECPANTCAAIPECPACNPSCSQDNTWFYVIFGFLVVGLGIVIYVLIWGGYE